MQIQWLRQPPNVVFALNIAKAHLIIKSCH